MLYMSNEQKIRFDETTFVSITGNVETGSKKKYNNAVDLIVVNVRSDSVGITLHNKNSKICSVGFKTIDMAPRRVLNIINTENSDLLSERAMNFLNKSN